MFNFFLSDLVSCAAGVPDVLGGDLRSPHCMYERVNVEVMSYDPQRDEPVGF